MDHKSLRREDHRRASCLAHGYRSAYLDNYCLGFGYDGMVGNELYHRLLEISRSGEIIIDK